MKRFFSFVIVLLVIGLISFAEPLQENVSIIVSAKDLERETYKEIWTTADLLSMNDDLSSNYILMADIDISSISNWAPIGDSLLCHHWIKTGDNFRESDNANYFSGIFNGNGFSIKGMNCSFESVTNGEADSSVISAGLFAHVSNATIKNLILEDVNINIYLTDNQTETNENWTNYVLYGTLCASEADSTIENCRIVNGIVNSKGVYAGGAVGAAFGGELKNIENHLDGDILGGIVCQEGFLGSIYSNTPVIVDCVNYGDIIGAGIVKQGEGIVQNCYNFGKTQLSGIIQAGYHGIVIDKCVNYGDIRIENHDKSLYIGGIMGDGYDFTISNCFNYGSINVKTGLEALNYLGLSIAGISASTVYSAKEIVKDCSNYGDITIDAEESLTSMEIMGVCYTGMVSGLLKNAGTISVIHPNYNRTEVVGVSKYLRAEEDVCLINSGDIIINNADLSNNESFYISAAGVVEQTEKIADNKYCRLFNEGNILIEGDFAKAYAAGTIYNYGNYSDTVLTDVGNVGKITINCLNESAKGTFGGLVGVTSSKKIAVTNAYNAGIIELNGSFIEPNIGSILGASPFLEEYDIQNCYSWKKVTTLGLGDSLIKDCILEIEDTSAEESFSGFDFNRVWNIKNDLYPSFKEADTNRYHLVKYDCLQNGGSISTKTITTVGEFEELDLTPIAVKKGWQFIGWNTNANAITALSSLKMGLNDVVLYAIFKSPSDLGSLTYSFRNSHEGFGYEADYIIPSDSYYLVYGKNTLSQTLFAQAKAEKEKGNTWQGNCYGMSTTTSFFNSNVTNAYISDYNSSASSVYDLKPSDANSKFNNVTLTRFIESMQVSQFYNFIQDDYKNNSNKVAELCNLINGASTTGRFPVIALFGPEGGHAVIGYAVEKINSTESQIKIYDCNYPNIDRYITLSTDTEGNYIDWQYQIGEKYDPWGSSREGCKMSYVPYDHYKAVWDYRGDAATLYQQMKRDGIKKDGDILSINSESFEVRNVDGELICKAENGIFTSYDTQVHELLLADIDLSGSGYRLAVPTGYYEIINKDKKLSSLEVDVVNVDLGATITTQSDSLSIAVDDTFDLNSVTVDAAQGEAYEVNLLSSIDNGYDAVTLSGIGGGTSVGLSFVQGELGYSIQNSTGVTLTVDGQKQDLNQNEEPEPQLNPNACPYCGQVHTGFFGAIVGFFHRIIYRLTHLFG